MDGLPSEVYYVSGLKYVHYFIRLLKKFWHKNELTSSQKVSVISLPLKKGDRNLLTNNRPVSLPNTDSVIAFVLSKRLQNILSKVVNKNQTAFVKGRYISENAKLILDVLDYFTTQNESGIHLFLDFEKAFDSVEWDFVYSV